MTADLVGGELDRVHERIAGRFRSYQPRARLRDYVSGLAAGLERKNGRTLALRDNPGTPRPFRLAGENWPGGRPETFVSTPGRLAKSPSVRSIDRHEPPDWAVLPEQA